MSRKEKCELSGVFLRERVPIHPQSESKVILLTPVTKRQPTRQRATNATEIKKQSWGVNTCLGFPRQVFTSYSRLLISTAFVVVRRGNRCVSENLYVKL